MSPSVGGRNIANASPHFPIPVLRRPRCLPIERQYYDFQACVVVGRHLHGSIRMRHIDAKLSS